MTEMSIDQILQNSPEFNGEKTAYYSTSCVWWTSFPDDLGNTMKMGGYPAGMVIYHPDGTEKTIGDDHPGLPCCPHCGSLLMQAPLEGFIEHAKKQPEHYGKGGLDTFVNTHHRNMKGCRKKF